MGIALELGTMEYCDRCKNPTKYFPKNSDICFKCKRTEEKREKKESDTKWKRERERIDNGDGCSCGPNEDCMWCRSHWENRGHF